MIMLFQQLERFRVERFKQLRNRKWAWVTVGEFNAASLAEARKKGRDALANKTCILRAIPVGTKR